MKKELEVQGKSNKVLVGRYLVSKTGTSTEEYGNCEKLAKWSEEDVVNAVYNVAPRIYYKKNWKNMHYEFDDFKQDAAMYILDLFKRNYFPTDHDKLEPIIYRMLDGYFMLNKFRGEKAYSDSIVSLDQHINNFYTSSSTALIDMLIDDTTKITCIDISAAKSVIGTILCKLEVEPFKTRKHKYIGDYDNKKIRFSERNVARLVFKGKTLYDIIDIYGKTTSNIGKSCEASFVFHKVKDTLGKIKDTLKGLPSDDAALLEKYVNNAFNNSETGATSSLAKLI